MSEGQVISGATGAGAPQVRAAIARAAQATGIDFNYLLAQARLESSLDPSARAGTSSAAGLYQFTQGTWAQTLGRHGDEHGMGWVASVIQGGGLSDPSMRAHIMGLRYDAGASALMAAELASDNRAELTGVLGREPDSTELYMAHFLGIAGARKFLGALRTDPGQSAAALLPAAAGANRTIFYEGGMARSVGGVMDLMRAKVAGAMEGPGAMPDFGGAGARPAYAAYAPYAATAPEPVQQPAWQPPMGQIAQEFHAGLPEPATPPSAPASRSMAETLRSAFGGTAEGTPANVRAAYTKLARLGL